MAAVTKPIASLRVGFEKLSQEETTLTRLRRVARDVGKFIAEDMASRAPKDKGRLADDIMVSIERGATVDQIVVKIGPSKKTAWRANFIEYGVRPHVIQTKTSRALVDRETGMVYGVGAKHPGIPADPFIGPALENNQEEAADMFARDVHEMILEAFR